MTVYESDLPGVGKKYEVELDGDRALVVVVHNSGRREVFLRESADEDARALFELSDATARRVGAILEGAYFSPEPAGDIEMLLGDDGLIDWLEVPASSRLAGRTLADAGLRQRTGATVLAIQRQGETITNPTGETALVAGDTLIVFGTADACRSLEALLDAE